MDSFIEEFFEEWMDSVINDTQLFQNNYGNGFVNNQISNMLYDNENQQDLNENQSIENNVVSNIYRIRRTLQLENQMTQLENNMFQNLYEILTDQFLPHDTFDDFEDVKVILTKDEFHNLKHSNITDENDRLLTQNEQCNICMENYCLNEQITKLDCNHIFHSHCIEHWLCTEHVTCPVCRKDVREII